MGREYERLFGTLPSITAPAYLCERVFGALARERVRTLRTRLVFSSCIGIASLVAMVFALRTLVAAMAASGFTSYASLLISDSGTTLTNGQTFLLSLLESLPGVEVMVTLACLAVLIQSLRVMITSGLEWQLTSARYA